MLADEGTTVDAYNLIAWESLAEHFGSTAVIVGLGVGGVEYGSVYHKEVGVGGWQAFAVFYYGIGHRQGEQTVGLSCKGAESIELFFHLAERFVVLVLLIGTLHVDDGVVGAEAGQGINVAVRIITCQVAMVQPEHLLYVEGATQVIFNLGLRHLPVAVGREQTLGGGEQRTPPIAFDGASLKDKA